MYDKGTNRTTFVSKKRQILNLFTVFIMEQEKEILVRRAFEDLRPVCVELSRNHTRANVAKLQKHLKTADRAALQPLQEYLLFPLRLILKQSKDKSVVVLLFAT